MVEETGKDAPKEKEKSLPPAATHQDPPEPITVGGKTFVSLVEFTKSYEHAQTKISEQGDELGRYRAAEKARETALDSAPADAAKPATHVSFVEQMFEDSEAAESALADRIAEKLLPKAEAAAEQREMRSEFFRKHPGLKGQNALINQILAEMEDEIKPDSLEVGLDKVAMEAKKRILESAKTLGFADASAEIVDPTLDATIERASGDHPASQPTEVRADDQRKPKDMVTRMSELQQKKRTAATRGVDPKKE